MAAWYLLLMLLAGATPDGPLATTSSWVLEPGADECAMAQRFDGRHGKIVLGVRQRVASRDATIVVEQPARRAVSYRSGVLTLTIDGQAVKAGFSTWRQPGTSIDATRFPIDAEQVALLHDAKEVSIATDDGVRLDLAPNQMPAAFAMLRNCGGRLLRRFGIDPAAESKVATPATRTTTENWITSADYPAEARHAGKRGVSFILWTIDKSGNIEDCRTISSSGTALLDQTACDLAKQRVHYHPALDAAGTPIESHDSQAVVWFLETRMSPLGPPLAAH